MNKAIAVVSGGLDSTVMTYFLKSEGYDVTMVSFNYGQKHKKELVFAANTAKYLSFPHHVVDLSGIAKLISNSVLTSDAEVPEGHYAEENMKATVVPNRNMMMLSIAGAIAVNEHADFVVTGVHGGDHYIYPDCRPEFVAVTALALEKGNEGFGNFLPASDLGSADLVNGKYGPIWAPYISADKTYIAAQGMELGVPFETTWSCYKGGENHCGRCGTCCERLEAIHDAGAAAYDQTVYEDSEYWKEVVANGPKS